MADWQQLLHTRTVAEAADVVREMIEKGHPSIAIVSVDRDGLVHVALCGQIRSHDLAKVGTTLLDFGVRR